MAKSKYDWEAIRAEWDLGQLPIREIARQHQMPDHTPIVRRAERYGWPARPQSSEIVTAIVTTSTREGAPVTNTPRMALLAFDRVIRLLHRHRRLAGALADEIGRLLEDIDKHRRRYDDNPLGMPLYESDAIATIVSKCMLALSKLAPLERKAFGLNDHEGPSEFDALTTEQLEALGEMIKQRLGQTGITE